MHSLDNPAWTALTTLQAHLALGDGLARRYPDDLTPIAAVGRRDQGALDELATLVADGDWVSLPATLDGIVSLVRCPLVVKFTKTLVQMVCSRRMTEPPASVELSVLSAPDIPDMMALAALTHPGPFRSHTYRFGTYLGIRLDDRLAAMGGQRMHLPGYRELSAICTHPDYRGRGLARTIVSRLVAATFEEGLTPFLHVEEQNQGAQALYGTLGFVERARLPLVVVERTSKSRLL
jgi:predicted GNAT family acetyltransferase